MPERRPRRVARGGAWGEALLFDRGRRAWVSARAVRELSARLVEAVSRLPAHRAVGDGGELGRVASALASARPTPPTLAELSAMLRRPPAEVAALGGSRHDR